jgi:hypothetical protein
MTSFEDRASTATRLPPIGIDPSTPDGLSKAFSMGASECLMAAMELDRGFSDRTGEYIATFHAIELGLKAFLIKCGVPEWGLREKPYGHDLVCLYNMAKQRGLSLGIKDVDEMLAWINEWHHCGVKIRYEFTEQRTLPICATLFPLAEAIIKASN